jgi:hypothetical protein
MSGKKQLKGLCANKAVAVHGPGTSNTGSSLGPDSRFEGELLPMPVTSPPWKKKKHAKGSEQAPVNATSQTWQLRRSNHKQF